MSDILVWSEGLPEATHPAGTQVIREGDEHCALQVLVSGAVEVVRDGTVVARFDEPGAVFGEMSVLLGGPASATVRCTTESRIRRCDDPRSVLAEHPRLALAIAETLARRLDTITGYLVDLRRQYADRTDHLGLVHTVLESLGHHQGRAVEPGSEREPDGPC